MPLFRNGDMWRATGAAHLFCFSGKSDLERWRFIARPVQRLSAAHIHGTLWAVKPHIQELARQIMFKPSYDCTPLIIMQYWQLFILRMLTGISIGGAMPLCYSLLGVCTAFLYG